MYSGFRRQKISLIFEKNARRSLKIRTTMAASHLLSVSYPQTGPPRRWRGFPRSADVMRYEQVTSRIAYRSFPPAASISRRTRSLDLRTPASSAFGSNRDSRRLGSFTSISETRLATAFRTESHSAIVFGSKRCCQTGLRNACKGPQPSGVPVRSECGRCWRS